MSRSRLSLALEAPELGLPPEGMVGVFLPPAEADLSTLPADRVEIIQPHFPENRAWAARGYRTVVRPSGGYAMSVVCVPRAKAQAFQTIAEASEATPGGWVVIDGQKADGIDSILRTVRARTEVTPPVAKAHGKVFAARSGPDLTDLKPAPPAPPAPGFVTRPGVFSADGVDPGSALLAGALPDRLGPHVVDLGAGWGWLAAQVLGREGVERLDLVESDHVALDCARANIADPRAHFHWADATDWMPQEPADAVVMNPPFHVGRKGDPRLGQAFVAAAARMLVPSGALWMVANRHLPYERTLAEHFEAVEELPGTAAYKLFRARRPRRLRRTSRRRR